MPGDGDKKLEDVVYAMISARSRPRPIFNVGSEKPDATAEQTFFDEMRRRIYVSETEKQNSAEIAALEQKVREHAADIEDQNALIRKLQLDSVFRRITPQAHAYVQSGNALYELLVTGGQYHAFILSVDIRRSTELMLRAIDPRAFARFITEVCSALKDALIKQRAVFDKFTGDGILAFFPEPFSGKDAGYLAIAAANECHEIFAQKYREYRNSFSSVLYDAGLGVGIDCGEVMLANIGDGITAIGRPVVYACRFGGTDAGTTLLNQSAYAAVASRFGRNCLFEERRIRIKNEEDLLGYAVTLTEEPPNIAPPPWLPSAER